MLKASPDLSRLAVEAAALAAWHTDHAPAVIAFDEQLGALLLEAIEPGTPLIVSMAYPALESVAGLLSALHGQLIPDGSYPAVAQRVDDLFRSSTKLYERDPQLTELIPSELYERGHALAARLVQHWLPLVLIHGDLTPPQHPRLSRARSRRDRPHTLSRRCRLRCGRPDLVASGGSGNDQGSHRTRRLRNRR